MISKSIAGPCFRKWYCNYDCNVFNFSSPRLMCPVNKEMLLSQALASRATKRYNRMSPIVNCNVVHIVIHFFKFTLMYNYNKLGRYKCHTCIFVHFCMATELSDACKSKQNADSMYIDLN